MNRRTLVEQIHASGKQLVLALTGGGSPAIAALLEVPGASASVLEAVVPYSTHALEQWLGSRPEQYCSEQTARAMAMGAFLHARRLSEINPRLLRGIGMTASLVSNRPKRGPHRVHVAWQSADTTAVASCELPKGQRTRSEEEEFAATLVLNAIAAACDLDARLPIDGHSDFNSRDQRARPEWTSLMLANLSHVAINCTRPNGIMPFAVLFPGAFNPIHSGHVRMADFAARRLGLPVTWELSIENIDKQLLDFVELADRLEALDGRSVLLTRAPRFVDKAKIAPGCTFVVGVDTIIRVGDAKYYDNRQTDRDEALACIADAGCRFLVVGHERGGSFQSLRDANIPASLRALCTEVPDAEFRKDFLSTNERSG